MLFEIQQTQTFRDWLSHLRDRRATWLIASRLERLKYGHWGDINSIGAGISELRIHFGPGYRIYFQRTGQKIIILLCGGDKNSQKKDIHQAQAIGLSLREKNHDGKTNPL